MLEEKEHSEEMESSQHKRIRLQGKDYGENGYYFVTIDVKHMKPLLGTLIGAEVKLSARGELVQSIWNTLPQRFAGVYLDEYVLMPDHMHGIILINRESIPSIGPSGRPLNLHEMLRQFKAVSTRLIRETLKLDFAWHERYYDYCIRNGDERQLNTKRRYIFENPMRRAQRLALQAPQPPQTP